jgi:hypothetical protein
MKWQLHDVEKITIANERGRRVKCTRLIDGSYIYEIEDYDRMSGDPRYMLSLTRMTIQTRPGRANPWGEPCITNSYSQRRTMYVVGASIGNDEWELYPRTKVKVTSIGTAEFFNNTGFDLYYKLATLESKGDPQITHRESTEHGVITVSPGTTTTFTPAPIYGMSTMSAIRTDRPRIGGGN